MPEGHQQFDNQPPYQTIDVKPIAGALGAEVSGPDLSKPLDDDVFAEIRRAWLENNVIFFRDQDMTSDQYLAFAKRWGGIHLHPYMQGLPDHPEIFEIEKKEGDVRNFGNRWHTDQMFTAQPAMATMLYAKELPPVGGDTQFANLYLAYDALSDGMKEMLGRMKSVNNGDNKRRYGGLSRAERYKAQGSSMQTKVKDPGDIQTISEHPLIRTHPETGRKALYIGSHTEKFAGMTHEESEPLLNFLMEHSHRPEFTCRFSWEVGSVAFWDNRCSQHYAINDYSGGRRMHRITIQGDTPY